MAILKFENDINGTEEKTYIVSPKTSRTQMAKIMNRAFSGTKWYTIENADEDWAYFDNQNELDTINGVCQKYNWVVTTTLLTKTEAKACGNWKDKPATDNQINYLNSLKVDISIYKNLSRGFASQLIDAAKNDQLGNILGAFYTDGSN
ncbi:MAG: hypothetical protein ACYTEQ_09495 [Planctomycetota bacterium]|jgi:hypothetical protein